MKRKSLLIALIKNFVTSICLFILLYIFSGNILYIDGLIVAILYFILGSFNYIFISSLKNGLLEKRITFNKENNTQILSVVFSSLIIFFAMLSAGISYKYKYMMFNNYKYVIAGILIFLGYVLYIRVFKENKYLSATISNNVPNNIITTGPYSIIRHPMYSSIVLMVIGFGFLLGSLIGLLISILLIPFLIIRILDEEKILLSNKKYRKYKQDVKYRLIPYVW